MTLSIHDQLTWVNLRANTMLSRVNQISMEDPNSRERVMHWIYGHIPTEREEVAWVSNPYVHIMKASPTFPTKVW